MTARPTLRTDETNNTYDNWKVVVYAGSKRGKSLWKVECIHCGYTAVSLGHALRKGVYPRHKCTRQVCRKCNRSSDEVKFKGKGRFGNICIDCRKEYEAEWRNKNSDYITAYLSEWTTENKKKVNKYHKSERERVQQCPYRYLTYIINDKARLHRYHMTQSDPDWRAKRTQSRPELHHFSITPEFLHQLWDKQEGRCAITGMAMTHKFSDLESVSIDRIESDKGYVDGNIQLVCRWANLAKGRFSNDAVNNVLTRFAHHRFQPFLVTAPEIMAMAGPIIEWLRKDGRNPLIIAGTDKAMVGYRHSYGKTGDAHININFFNDRIEVKTDAEYTSDDAFATFTDFADPNLFDNIINVIRRIQGLDRNKLFEMRDARRNPGMQVVTTVS